MQDNKKDTDVYNRLLDSEGEGGMIWENGIVTCILSCMNRIASLCPMQDIACLGLMHGDDPERCYGREVGGGVHVWECMYTRDEFMSMYGKTNTKKMLIIFKRKKKTKFESKGEERNRVVTRTEWDKGGFISMEIIGIFSMMGKTELKER